MIKISTLANMITKITQKEYADLMDVTVSTISHRLRNEIKLPGIIKTEKFRDWWILYYEDSTDLVDAQLEFKVTSGRPPKIKKKKKAA